MCPLSLPQNKDGSYTGFIKVHLKLVRPVSVPPPRKAPSAQDSPGRSKTAAGSALKRRTSFYLPKDTAKHLHISSRSSSREVIQALLKKFTVLDNPAKFALFERSERHDQGESWTPHSSWIDVTSLTILYFQKPTLKMEHLN